MATQGSKSQICNTSTAKKKISNRYRHVDVREDDEEEEGVGEEGREVEEGEYTRSI